MEKQEALGALERIATQRHFVYSEFDKAIRRIMKPTVRDPLARAMEAQDKEQATLMLAVAMQENIKATLIARGASEEQVENLMRVYRQEAREGLKNKG